MPKKYQSSKPSSRKALLYKDLHQLPNESYERYAQRRRQAALPYYTEEFSSIEWREAAFALNGLAWHGSVQHGIPAWAGSENLKWRFLFVIHGFQRNGIRIDENLFSSIYDQVHEPNKKIDRFILDDLFLQPKQFARTPEKVLKRLKAANALGSTKQRVAKQSAETSAGFMSLAALLLTKAPEPRMFLEVRLEEIWGHMAQAAYNQRCAERVKQWFVQNLIDQALRRIEAAGFLPAAAFATDVQKFLLAHSRPRLEQLLNLKGLVPKVVHDRLKFFDREETGNVETNCRAAEMLLAMDYSDRHRALAYLADEGAAMLKKLPAEQRLPAVIAWLEGTSLSGPQCSIDINAWKAATPAASVSRSPDRLLQPAGNRLHDTSPSIETSGKSISHLCSAESYRREK